jgi:hypothetical protein
MKENGSKFKTKIVQRFVNWYEFYDLLLSDGRRVASGSLSHCWNERERWEKALDVRAASKCKRQYYRKHPKELQLELNFDF